MSPHLADESVVDLAEGRGGESDRAHSAACGRCAGRVSEAREMLCLALAADVPEPPAGYWSGLTRAVGRRIDEEPPGGAGWGWSWLLPLAAAAAGVAVAVTPVRGRLAPTPAPAVAVAPWSALPPLDEDAALPALEAAGERVTIVLEEGRGLGSFVAGLTDEEAQALAERLHGPRKEGEL